MYTKGFSFIPTSVDELKAIIKNEEILNLFKFLQDISGIKDPAAFIYDTDKEFKVLRYFYKNPKLNKQLCGYLNLHKLSYINPSNLKITKYTLKWGSGSRGSSGVFSKGFKTEELILEDINGYIQGNTNFNYPDVIKMISEIVDLKSIKDVKAEGSLNKKRPLTFTNGEFKILDGSTNIGKVVSDITLIGKNDKMYYISIKYGNTISMAQNGVKKILKKEEILSGEVLNKEGRELLDFFKIDNKLFCETFILHYKKINKENIDIKEDLCIDVTDKIDKEKIKKLLKQLVGYNYIYIHIKDKGNEVYEMTEELLEEFTNINNIIIRYPRNGIKKVELFINCEKVKYVLVFRNSKGGITPSHFFTMKKIKRSSK